MQTEHVHTHVLANIVLILAVAPTARSNLTLFLFCTHFAAVGQRKGQRQTCSNPPVFWHMSFICFNFFVMEMVRRSDGCTLRPDMSVGADLSQAYHCIYSMHPHPNCAKCASHM